MSVGDVKRVFPISESFANALLIKRGNGPAAGFNPRFSREGGASYISRILDNINNEITRQKGIDRIDRIYEFYTSETGNGVSIAYMLKVLDGRELKQAMKQLGTVSAEWDAAGPRLIIQMKDPGPRMMTLIKTFYPTIKGIDTRDFGGVEKNRANQSKIRKNMNAQTEALRGMEGGIGLPEDIVNLIIGYTEPIVLAPRDPKNALNRLTQSTRPTWLTRPRGGSRRRNRARRTHKLRKLRK